jgi:influenza virus NS1A-binding protein
MPPDELIEKPMSPMQYARSGLGTAEMNGRLIAAGENRIHNFSETAG